MNCSNKSPKASHEEGFTLIEVLVVVIIIGILAAIAGPSWLGFLSRQRMNTVQNNLTETLRQAQTDAKQLRQDRDVVINTATNSVPTVTINGSSLKLTDGNVPAGSILLSASTPTGASTTITFDYQGRPKSNNLPFVVTIKPSIGTVKRCVIVSSLLGSIRTAQNAQCDNVTASKVNSQ